MRNGIAQLVSIHDPIYSENYHIIVIKWDDNRNTTIVLDDNSNPLNPIPHICWKEIDKLRKQNEQTNHMRAKTEDFTNG